MLRKVLTQCAFSFPGFSVTAPALYVHFDLYILVCQQSAVFLKSVHVIKRLSKPPEYDVRGTSGKSNIKWESQIVC